MNKSQIEVQFRSVQIHKISSIMELFYVCTGQNSSK